MPKEHRKRGKKHKKNAQREPDNNTREEPSSEALLDTEAGPSWIVSAPDTSEQVNAEAPFGYVDAEVKAYFRTVDLQMRGWQEGGTDMGVTHEDGDPNEEKRLFFVAALREMSGKEKELATDADGSTILERMLYSMDDFVRRVFVDSLSGSWVTLGRHRFASHVCQTLFSVAAETVSRECRGIYPETPNSNKGEDVGELRTLTQLVLDACEELLPSFATLIMDPFASHVLRALLLLLCPSTDSSASPQSTLRSKKSAAFKARQGPMKSVFADQESAQATAPRTPTEFAEMGARFVHALKEELGENEVRALGADKVASPVLQILLEIEARENLAEQPDSLMDRVLVGLISSTSSSSSTTPHTPSDYLTALMRDPTASHLLETAVTHTPPLAFTALWRTYFSSGALPRLAMHPVANFVVARAVGRLGAGELVDACKTLAGAWVKIVQAHRVGVLKAVVDRAAILAEGEDVVCEAVFAAFGLSSPEDRLKLVPCALALLPLEEYRDALTSRPAPAASKEQERPRKKSKHDAAKTDPLEPKIQGVVLLQSMLRLAAPHNEVVTTSIHSFSIPDILAIASHPASSRVLDALLDSPAVTFKTKRTFVTALLGHYHVLVDDRIGSRVGDRMWAYADPYLREKIARSLIPQEQFLLSSQYGKFFARGLNLYVLQRRPDEWKELQVKARNSTAPSPSKTEQPSPAKSKAPTSTEHSSRVSPAQEAGNAEKRKRPKTQEAEINALFDGALGRKTKKRAVALTSSVPSHSVVSEKAAPTSKDLDQVLSAIRAAPDGAAGGRKKGRRTR